jgi:hypothetical protein
MLGEILADMPIYAAVIAMESGRQTRRSGMPIDRGRAMA